MRTPPAEEKLTSTVYCILWVFWRLQIINRLSVRTPPAEEKLERLKKVAEEQKVEWDPAMYLREIREQRDAFPVSVNCCFVIVTVIVVIAIARQRL